METKTIVHRDMQRWQFLFAAWVGQSQHGILFVGARPYTGCCPTGEFLRPDALPESVVTFLAIEKLPSNQWVCPEFKTVEALKQQGEGVTAWMTSRSTIEGQAKGVADIEVITREEVPIIAVVDLDEPDNYIGDDEAGVYIGIADRGGQFYVSGTVDTEHDTLPLFIDEGPFEDYDSAYAAGAELAQEWCYLNDVIDTE